MDSATLDRLREQLQEDRTAHLEQLEEHGASPYDDAVKDTGIEVEAGADAGQATEERSELLASLEQARQRVRAVDEALHRMDEGTYGTCVDCGDRIPAERLEIRPLSVRCVRCAETS
ncbi:MAG: TraR/DksA C4-type zinc finger protein [Nitriliruptor sp.]|uniref:TraR/DksA family transcriptional regulator n=1 Tax=Nitriliruptor sp. TaxID=2448056 RepID=UPI0034A07405